MNKLPAEIFVWIVSYLSISDRLVCIRVCKTWYKTIATGKLFDKLEFNDEDQLQQALAMFREKQYLGKSVDQLTISLPDISYKAMITLPALFPNITVIKCLEDFDEETMVDAEVDLTAVTKFKQALEKWKNVARIVDQTRHLQITQYILGDYICANLERLEVSLHGWFYSDGLDDRLSHSMLKSLLNNIHDAPALDDIKFVETNVGLAERHYTPVLLA
jgi:hypothetical protein